MNVILFGATGMVGQGVLRECLDDEGVGRVLAVGRRATGRTHPKLRELVQEDLFDVERSSVDLAGYDACFFCLGVSSAGMSEAEYTRLTYDLTLGWARAVSRNKPHFPGCVDAAPAGWGALSDPVPPASGPPGPSAAEIEGIFAVRRLTKHTSTDGSWFYGESQIETSKD